MPQEPRSPRRRSGGDVTAGGTGLSPNVAGALSYLVGPLTGILFLVLDRDRPFVRFHAAQSIVASVAWVAVWIAVFVLEVILGAVPLIGWILGALVSLAIALGGFVLWLVLMFRAYQGEEWELPVVGEFARRLSREATGP